MHKRRRCWRVRPAQITDNAALLTMTQELAAHHGERARLTPERLAALMNEPHAFLTMLVMEDENGNLQGFAAGHPVIEFQHGVKGFQIQNFMVRFKQRRQGHGRDLMRATVRHAVENGAQKIKLGVAKNNWNARAFYMRLGFTETELGTTDARCVLEGKALQSLIKDDDEERYYPGPIHDNTAYTYGDVVIAVA